MLQELWQEEDNPTIAFRTARELHQILSRLVKNFKYYSGRFHAHISYYMDTDETFCWNCGNTFGPEQYKTNTGCTCKTGVPVLKFWTGCPNKLDETCFFPKNYFLVTHKGKGGMIKGDQKVIKIT